MDTIINRMNLTPIFDGHNDTLLSLFVPKKGKERSFFEQANFGALDLPRARAGGMVGGIFAIFTPPPEALKADVFTNDRLVVTAQGYEVLPFGAVDPAFATPFVDEMIVRLHEMIKQSQGQIGLATSRQTLQDLIARGSLAIVLHLEGAEAIHANLDNLEAYYQRGLRSIGLVWSRPNVFGNGIDFRFPSSPDTGDGLTEAGKALVKACNRMGIMVDLAHLNEKGFWDVARISDMPLVVSHIGVHSLCGSSRNLTDAQIDAVGKSGGLVGIMFEPSEIREDGHDDENTPLSEIARHVDYVVQRIGIDHVGLGSDFDGPTMPKDLPDAAAL